MDIKKKKGKRSKFFTLMGIIGLGAIFIGFSKTFILPIAQQKFTAPVSIYIHAFFSFSWVLLFTIQSYLITNNNLRLHRRLGLTGLLIAIITSFSLVPVAKFVIVRDLNLGLGEIAYSNSVGLLTTGIIFLTLVGFGIFYRRKPQIHKRLLLLATIVLLWPAWFRFRHFFPDVPRPDIWFALVLANSLIIISWIWDKMINHKINPVLLYGGIAIMCEQALEILLYDSELWRKIGKTLYHFV